MGGQGGLPQNIDAEQAVLAAALLDAEAAEDVVAGLEADSFVRPAHKVMFEAVASLVRRRASVDAITVAAELESAGNLEAAGGRAYLTEVSGCSFSMLNWRAHVSVVRHVALQRDILAAAAGLQGLAHDMPADDVEAVEEAEGILLEATGRYVASEFVQVRDLTGPSIAEMQAVAAAGGMAGAPSGFPDLDSLVHGFRAGDLAVLAARPGVGKTALALNIAVNAAKAGVRVAFFSLEMDRDQITQRILCSEARASLSRMRAGRLREGEWGRIADAKEVVDALDFAIDDFAGLTVMEARVKARRQLRRLSEAQTGLVVVDYLQLMQPESRRRESSRNVEVGEISRGLKMLAKQVGVPVLALSQLSRAVEARGSRRPMLSDLRDSGSIEQDADIVMFVDRAATAGEAALESRPDAGTASLIVAKHRNGPTGEVPLVFDAECTRFESYADADGF